MVKKIKRRNLLIGIAATFTALFQFKFLKSYFKTNNRQASVFDYGAVGNGISDDTKALINAINDNIGRTLNWGDCHSTFAITEPLVVPSNSKWKGNATIYNINESNNPNKWACIHPGGFHPAYFDQLNKSIVYIMDSEITFELENVNFETGDVVWIYSIQGYTRKDWTFPYDAKLHKIRMVKGRKLYLESPTEFKNGKYYLARANDNNITVMNGNNLQICQDTIIDGLSLESKNGPAMQRGGLFRCDFSLKIIKGTNGIYLNAVTESKITVNKLICSRKFIDLAGNSFNSFILVQSAKYIKNKKSDKISLIAFNENTNECIVKFHFLDCGGFNYESSIAQFNSSKNCILEISSGNCFYGLGNAFVFQIAENINNKSVCENNTFMINDFHLGSNIRSAFFWNPGSKQQSIINCGVSNTKIFSERFVSGYSAIVDGQDSFITDDCNIEGGKIKIEQTAINPLIPRRLIDDKRRV